MRWRTSKIATSCRPADEATPHIQASAKDPDEVTRIFGVFGGALPHWEVFTADNVKRVLAGAALARAG